MAQLCMRKGGHCLAGERPCCHGPNSFKLHRWFVQACLGAASVVPLNRCSCTCLRRRLASSTAIRTTLLAGCRRRGQARCWAWWDPTVPVSTLRPAVTCRACCACCDLPRLLRLQ